MRKRVLSLAVVGALMAASIFTEASADTYTATVSIDSNDSVFTHNYKDTIIVDNTWIQQVCFCGYTKEDDNVMVSCIVTCGFKDGPITNYDTIQVKTQNGMLDQQSATVSVKNSKGTSSSSATAKGTYASTKQMSVKHTGTPVTYKCIMKLTN